MASSLGCTEVGRALLPFGEQVFQRGREVLDRIELVRVNDRVLSLAAELRPHDLRSLDAIHLATAKILLRVKIVVTYDGRLAEAAHDMGWKVVAPS